MGERWGLREAGLVVRSKARRPPSFGPRLPLTNKVRYIMSGSRRGERGKMCPFKGTEGTKDTLEALEKGLKSERQAAQSRLALVG